MKTGTIVALAIGTGIAWWVFKGSASAGRIKGDVDNDGVVTANDAHLVAQHIVGAITLVGADFEAADMNSDGLVNSADLLLIDRLIGV